MLSACETHCCVLEAMHLETRLFVVVFSRPNQPVVRESKYRVGPEGARLVGDKT